MIELPIYKVSINMENGPNWSRGFVGRPTSGEILRAITRTRDVALNDDLEADGLAIAKTYQHFRDLVQDHYGGDIQETVVCHYAGVAVGNINLYEVDDPVFLTGDAMKDWVVL
jgi:hypothetical protein